MAEIPYFHRVLRTYLKEQLYPTLMQEGGYQKGNVLLNIIRSLSVSVLSRRFAGVSETVLLQQRNFAPTS